MSGSIDFPGRAAAPVVRGIPVQRFDALSGAWREIDAEPAASGHDELTVVTFNTWFQGGEQPLRHAGLLEVLRECNPDVVFLQETTVALLERILATEWIRAAYRYARAPFRPDAIPSHGVMLLSKLPLHGVTLHPIPTHMGRNLLVARSTAAGAPFTLATAHLESLKPNADVRGDQLRAIFAILEQAPDLVLAGDFNFCASWTEENRRIDARYADLWAVLRPDEPGYTQDTDANRMLAAAKGKAKRVRIDRILLRSDSARWKPRSVQLLGTRPVAHDSPKVFPSDHFGVAATLRT